jgi:hypothetical protein
MTPKSGPLSISAGNRRITHLASPDLASEMIARKLPAMIFYPVGCDLVLDPAVAERHALPRQATKLE